ncbi:hypothetical protein PVAP13_9KG107500 [Panicum virgatum]|uniref:Uncharacterized protein n=2 Tax=Panicum virgatum TaxID=38727 RepID=A0A8T0NMU8_PANVG|nr:hypothetical protein PVAP13_9KG107500 [Panicum virgatum]
MGLGECAAATAIVGQISFFFDWLSIVGSHLPIISYHLTKDWDSVLHDCFSLASLFWDAADTLNMLFYHMVFVNTCTSVWPYFYCLALLLASNHVFHLHKGMFCTMKDMSDLLKGVPRNTHQKPRQGNAMAFCLVGLLAVTLVCVVVITFGQQSYNWPYIEDNLFKLSCSVKIAVVLWPVIDRCAEGKFENDPRNVLWTKMAGTFAATLCSGFEIFSCSKGGMWSYHAGRRYMVLNIMGVATGIGQIICRIIGPKRIRFWDGVYKTRSSRGGEGQSSPAEFRAHAAGRRRG